MLESDHPVWRAYLQYLQRKHRRSDTIALYRTVLHDLWRFLAERGLRWDQITPELTDEWLTRPGRVGKRSAGLELQPWTQHTYGVVAARFYRRATTRAWLQGPNPLEDWEPPRAPGPRPRALPVDAITDLLAVVDPRIRMMIQLGYHQGLRVGEICRLRVQDLALDADPPSLFVRGKGGKDVWMELSPALGPHLRTWLLLRPGGAAPLIPNYRDPTRHLDPGYAATLLASAMRPKVGDSGHALRRTGATQLARATRDPYMVQAFLRQSSLDMQRHYVDMGGLLTRALAELPDPLKETR